MATFGDFFILKCSNKIEYFKTPKSFFPENKKIYGNKVKIIFLVTKR
jgi:hypothetical protein